MEGQENDGECGERASGHGRKALWGESQWTRAGRQAGRRASARAGRRAGGRETRWVGRRAGARAGNQAGCRASLQENERASGQALVGRARVRADARAGGRWARAGGQKTEGGGRERSKKGTAGALERMEVRGNAPSWSAPRKHARLYAAVSSLNPVSRDTPKCTSSCCRRKAREGSPASAAATSGP
eukprot:366467-Chlamydomonas_euryale.AAC.15